MNGTGANVLIKFTGDTKDVNAKMTGLNKTMGSVTKGFVAGSLITKGLSTAFNMVSSSVGNATKRLDTMWNYPKVMQNFGISAQEAADSIKRIDKSVQGLPTSLDQAVSGVQNIFMATKNLPKAEKMFRAINDSAMIFANGSTEAVDRFIYSYKQAMSAGKASAQDFNSMNDAIPGLMDKVAQAMGVSYAELKKGLSEGDISMKKFNQTLQKLDEKGGAGMKSFQTAAKDATGGIQTAISNMKTAITRGLATFIEGVDEQLAVAGFGGIDNVISKIGKGFETVLKALIPVVPPIVQALATIFNWMKKHEQLVKVLAIGIVGFVAAFKTISIIIGIINAVKTALMALKAIMIVVNAVMLANPIGIIIAAIAALVAIFVVLWKKCAWFRNFWIGLWKGIKNVFVTIVNWIKSNWKTILLFLINPFVGAFKYLYDHCAKFRNFINKTVTAIINFIKAIPAFLASLPGKIWAFIKKIPYYIGYAIGWIWGKYIAFWQRVWQIVTVDIPKFVNSIITWISQLPGKIWNLLKLAAIKIGLWVVEIAVKAKEAGSKFVNNAATFFKELPGKIWNALKIAVIKVGLWTINMATKAKEAGKNFVNGVINFFKTLPSKIWTFLVNTANKVITWKNNLVSKGKAAAKGLFNSIVNTLKSLPSKMLNIGKSIVQGLWNGIKNMKDWVISKIKGLGKGIIDGMKKALGIHSPSKKFMKLGQYSIVGYHKGIESKKPELNKLLSNLSTDVQKQLKGKKTNYAKIGKTLGQEFISGIEESLKSIRETADKFKETLSKVDLWSDNGLTDLSVVKEQIRNYAANLNKLKNQIPTSLYSQIMEMDREQGLEYTNALLNMDSNALKDYVSNWNAIQNESSKLANQWYESEAQKQAKTIANKYAQTLKTQFNSINKLMGGIGKNATQGLINGMLAQTKNLKGAGKTISNSIVNSLKKALKIKSPSRVMMGLGKYTTEGFIEGITSMQRELDSIMNSTFGLSPTVTGTASTHFSPEVNVTVQNNMKTDPLGQVVNNVKTFSGGAKNDYNYGIGG